MNYPIVILISGNGSNLQAIINAINKGKCRASIATVVSNHQDAYGLKRAKEAGLNCHCVKVHSGESREEYDKRLVDIIQPYHPKLIVLAGFMRILSAYFVSSFPQQIIYIHPSLLPKYPGLNTHRQVLQNQDREHGISIHYVDQTLDAGPLIYQEKLQVHTNESEAQLIQRIHHLEHKAYPRIVDYFAKQRISLENQTVLFDGQPLTNAESLP